MATSPTIASTQAAPTATGAIGAVGYPVPAAAPAVAPVPVPAAAPVPTTAPKTTVPTAVVTAAPAINDSTKKIGVVNQLAATQKTTQVPMATLVNATTGDRKAVAVGSQDAQNLFANGYVLEGAKAAAAPTPAPTPTNAGQAAANQPTGLTPLPTAPTAADQQAEGQAAADEFTAQNAAITAKSDAAFNDYQTQVNQMRNGTFPLTPDQQAMIDGITQTYQGLLADQKLANQNYEGAVKLSGIRAGRNMYAPEIELGNVNAAISAGTRALSKINTEMSSAIATARIAYQESNFKMLDSVYDRLSKHIEEQRKVVSDTYTVAKDALESAQKKFTNDMATANFNLEVAKETNKPILEADAKMKDFLYSEMQKYPDAGVTSADTVATATEKIKNSQSYKDAQAQTAANLEATKANTEQSKAAAAASYASAAKSRADAAGGTGSTEGLSKRAQQVLENPSLLEQYTPTERGKILDEFADNKIAFDAAGLQKVSAAQREFVAKYDSIESQANKALELANVVNTGPFAGRAGSVAQVFGKASPEFTDYNSAISDMNSVLVQLRSGAAVTDSEFKRIKGFIPSVNEDEKTAKQKIPKFIEAIAEAKSNYITRATQTTKQLMDSNKTTAKPTEAPPSGQIWITRNGQTGSISPSEFDPKTDVKL